MGLLGGWGTRERKTRAKQEGGRFPSSLLVRRRLSCDGPEPDSSPPSSPSLGPPRSGFPAAWRSGRGMLEGKIRASPGPLWGCFKFWPLPGLTCYCEPFRVLRYLPAPRTGWDRQRRPNLSQPPTLLPRVRATGWGSNSQPLPAVLIVGKVGSRSPRAVPYDREETHRGGRGPRH